MAVVVHAVEVLHVLVCHTSYCHQLLDLPMTDIFKPLLLALQPWPTAQLTFGASLACVAAAGWECSFRCYNSSRAGYQFVVHLISLA